MRRFVSLRTKLGGILCAFLALTLLAIALVADATATRAIAEQSRSREELLVHNVEISVNQVLFAGKYQAQAYAEALVRDHSELLWLAVVEGGTRRVIAHSDPRRVGERWDDPTTTRGLAVLGTGGTLAQAYPDATGALVHDWAAPYLRGYLRKPEGIIRLGLSGAREAALVRESRTSIGLMALLLLGLGATLAVALSVRLTSGLAVLTSAVRRFGVGDYAASVAPPDPPRDELDQLGLAFDDMAGRLRAYAQSIEREVAARTAELVVSEGRLRESEARLSAFVENATAVIYIKAPDGRYLLVNRGFEALVGRPRAELLGRRDHDVFGEAIGDQLRAADLAVLDGGEPRTFEEVVPFPDGPRAYLTVKFPLQDDVGGVRALGGISTDITDRKHLEEVLREQFTKLQELDRLKGEFVNAVSHDLRTPLTSIKGFAEFLEDEIGGPLAPRQHGYVAQIQHAARRLESLVDDLLDMARIDAGTFRLRQEPGDLREVVVEIAASLRPQAEDGHLALVVELPAEPLPVTFDARRMQQVLTNLLHNAVKFTPAGGTVTVWARRQDDGVRVEVADSGPGIAAEDHERLFQRFSQLQVGLAKGGTGLGLSISKAIVEAHGGAIGVESVAGRGAVFWFTLPAGVAADLAPEATPEAVPER